jgi:dihydropyrimidinase
MNVDYCTYEGFEVQGYPETVISRGEVVVRNHETVGRKGRGQFIRRKPYSGFVV